MGYEQVMIVSIEYLDYFQRNPVKLKELRTFFKMAAAFISYTYSVEGTEFTGKSRGDRRERGTLIVNLFINSLIHSFIQRFIENL